MSHLSDFPFPLGNKEAINLLMTGGLSPPTSGGALTVCLRVKRNFLGKQEKTRNAAVVVVVCVKGRILLAPSIMFALIHYSKNNVTSL